MDDDLLAISETWPGTTIDGEPRIVSGNLGVSRSADTYLLSLAVGPAGEGPEHATYVEFVLTAENARALAAVLIKENL
jgi:hypothetical protein